MAVVRKYTIIIQAFEGCRRGSDEIFLLEAADIFSDGVLRHPDGFTYRPIARIAFVGFPILAVHKIGIHRYLTRAESEAEDNIRQREKVLCTGILHYERPLSNIVPILFGDFFISRPSFPSEIILSVNGILRVEENAKRQVSVARA